MFTSTAFFLAFSQLLVRFLTGNFAATYYHVRRGRLLLEMFPSKLVDDNIFVLDEAAARLRRLIRILV